MTGASGYLMVLLKKDGIQVGLDVIPEFRYCPAVMDKCGAGSLSASAGSPQSRVTYPIVSGGIDEFTLCPASVLLSGHKVSSTVLDSGDNERDKSFPRDFWDSRWWTNEQSTQYVRGR